MSWAAEINLKKKKKEEGENSFVNNTPMSTSFHYDDLMRFIQGIYYD